MSKAENSSKMKVEVWSDIMCPFCYIGKRHYESALAKFDNASHIDIVWKSYQLDPTIPEDVEKGMTTPEYLSTRKGMPLQQVEAMQQQVTLMAAKAGLEYHLDDAVVYNSFKAHRVIQLAKTKGWGDKAEELFFHAHFTLNKDLGDTDTLVEVGKEVGLSAEEVHEALTNENYAYEVKQDIQEAQQIGVRGVPFFVFNRKYAISGAQPVEAFVETLEKSYAEWQKDNPTGGLEITDGNVCTPDGDCQ